MHLPFLIKERRAQDQWNNLLIPPHSGYSLEPNSEVQLISPCSEDSVEVRGRHISSKGQHSITPVKVLRDGVGQPSYINVVVTPIASLFVSNGFGKVQLERG